MIRLQIQDLLKNMLTNQCGIHSFFGQTGKHMELSKLAQWLAPSG